MTTSDILLELRKRRIELTPLGDRLRYRAPMGNMTPELRDAVVKNKSTLISVLGDRNGAQWIGIAVSVARKNAEGCFLCKWIVQGYDQRGRLVDVKGNLMGDYLFPVESQKEHLKIEIRRENDGTFSDIGGSRT